MESFNEVYANNHKKVLNYVTFKISNSIVAEELTNDIFMKVHKNLAKYDENKASMSTWVMNITANSIIDHYRKKKDYTLSLDAEHEDTKLTIMDKIVSPTDPFKEIVGGEINDTIQNAFMDLPDKYINIADLFFNDQLSYEEISKTLDLPIGTIKAQLNRTRKILQSKLENIRS